MSKLTKGPPLEPSDRIGLLAFADQLKDCKNTLESIGYLDEISSADNLRRIVQRLPFHLRTKFVEVADQIHEAGQRTNISRIAEFVKIKATAANNPVFGCVIDVARDRLDSQRRISLSPKELHCSMSAVTHSVLKRSIPEKNRVYLVTKKSQL